MGNPEPSAAGVDVLIVEGDATTRASLRQLLEQQGYRCAEAEDPRQALYLAARDLPRCLFLDPAETQVDGLALARQLRSDPRTRGIHIHCLTGRNDPQTREQAGLAGCEQFLTKPVDAARLLQIVREQVRGDAPETISGLTKDEAEYLLDWLEAHGWGDRQVCRDEAGGFLVRYRRRSP
jgi:CheY-like chemotaxis protein